ncbi:MAG: hypothetical protein L6V84_07275 [Oscillospiraceae bacterium]|nr:MAG: hypothetical protein L6V84_07275 [Oscillospiraceae bacterium]
MKSKWMRIPALCLALLLLGTAATVLPGAAELSVVFEENFDEYEGDVNASATKLATFFHVDANAIGDGYVRVEEDPSNGNLYLKNHVFLRRCTVKTGIRDPYEFAMTVYEMQGGHQAGVFFRAPACECAYYEGDGGDPDNQTSTGRSGIWVFVYRDRISVNIKAFDNSKPAKVANIYHAFPLPEGSDYGKGIELRIIDNGTDAQIMADGTLVCTLNFSEETGRKWTQNGIDRAIMLFKTVTMLGADGAEILTASDTYVSATESTIGWATRVADMRIDNVRVLMQTAQGDDRRSRHGHRTGKHRLRIGDGTRQHGFCYGERHNGTRSRLHRIGDGGGDRNRSRDNCRNHYGNG